MSLLQPHHRPRWFFIPVRVLLVTFLLTLLCFALSLLLGIFLTAVLAWVRGVNPNMAGAYRHIAIPGAVIAGVATLVSMSILEIRRYQRERVLAGMTRASSATS
jgi:nitrate reductase gamma subunit